MSREVMRQALDTAEGIVNSDWRKWHELATPEEFERWVKARADHLATALREALAQPKQEPVPHAVIAGALFDFMGWLTSRKERLVLSSVDEASPAVDALCGFAKMRGLSLDDAKVQDWHTVPQPAQQPLTDEQIKAVIASIDPDEQYMPKALRQFARAVEAAHGIKE